MKVYFNPADGVMREIAELPEPATKDEFYKLAYPVIEAFCNERNFKIYYYRTWVEPVDGVYMTKFDVGCHTQFFYVDTVVSQ